jgi:Bacterial Ig-like domain (group 2)
MVSLFGPLDRWLDSLIFLVVVMLFLPMTTFATKRQVYLGSDDIQPSLDRNSSGIAAAFPVVANYSGQINSLYVYLDSSNSAGIVWVGLYANYSGHPSTLLAQSAILGPAAGSWNSVAIPAVQVSRGTYYWIALLGVNGHIAFRDRGGNKHCYSESSNETTLTSLPATWWSGSQASSCIVSMFGSGATSSNVSINVSPGSTSLQVGQQTQFTATVSGTTNTAVTWTTSGGTVSSTGQYTAPSLAGTYTVTAQSLADTSKSASATVAVSQAIRISVSPTSASLQTGGQQQFTASVSGTTNTALTWSASAGTITSAGLYTAPSSAGTYTVTARSLADTSKSASATVAVSQAIQISVSPTSASVRTGGQQQFSAYVSGSSNTAVTWSTSGGTITSSGLYTAPNSAGNYTVQAASVADPTKSASASIGVTAQAISITISPPSTAMPEQWQQQFTAAVSGTSNTGATWAVTQGSGTITQTGLYTAPQVAETDIVSVTSQADATKSASATVTVTALHSVSLTWSPSTSSNINYYNVYRGTVNAGPYSLLKSGVTSTSYGDGSVHSGNRYYYVTTAVDLTGTESAYSDQATVVIPFP